jgi:hypothetical protein
MYIQSNNFLYIGLYILFFMINFNKIEAYDIEQSQISVYLSGAAYCDKKDYQYMKLIGPAKDFIYETLLYDIKTDLQGFIGYLPSYKTIYISLRGSSSKLNWMDDFEVRLVPYTSYPECNCKVHNGFYRSTIGIRNKTIDTIKLLQKRFPLYQIVLTGHSYGASTVQLLGMELEKEGFSVTIYNFGQPRIGNPNYANYANLIISKYWRFTHSKDIVPHLPPQCGFNYLHSCREVYEDEEGILNICSDINCEDPTCSMQYPLYNTSTNDHLYYLGHRVSCNESAIIEN